jgi:hypothetical protein
MSTFELLGLRTLDLIVLGVAAAVLLYYLARRRD